jgi:formylglycine-generating enzyme required for sulfatase activity
VARIFLCHASEDKAQVREAYHRLHTINGFEPWLDEEDLLPGQDWTREIPRALQKSDFILIFFSRNSVAKRGYVQREMKLALDALQELPEGTIHTIPVRLDDCEVPESFQHYHYANLFAPNGFDHIVHAIRAEIAKRSGPTQPPCPQPSPRAVDVVHRREEPATPPVNEKDRPEVHRHTTSDTRVITGLSQRQKRRLVLVGGLLLCGLVTVLYLVLSGRTPEPQPEPRTARTTEGIQPASSLTNSLGMQFALISAGEFQMGSTSGTGHDLVHTVRISKPFYLGLHEVTQGQWEAVMGNNPSYFKVDANRPVETVSWEEVQKFIDKLNAREGGILYRLPTEAEWEYAARAGSTTTYSFGDDSGQLGKYAWFAANALHTTHPVGKLQPNAWGLYDMHGNVWEWVQDWHGTYTTEPVTDPQGPASGLLRVSRGGGWQFTSWYCQSAYRYRLAPGNRLPYLGFRLLRTLP